MNGTLAVGLAILVAGCVAYTAGIVWAYPGRSFSLTAVMVGLTLAAIGRSLDGVGAT